MARTSSPERVVDKKKAGKQNAKIKTTRSKTNTSKQLKIQKALYQIADAASAVMDMQSFYTRLHRIVGELMYAKNFYVSLYDTTTQILSAPYFADEAGDMPPAPMKIDTSNKSLRAYVLLKGNTLHVSGEEIEKGRRQGIFTPMGTPAVDWVGVPLKIGLQVIGMLTVQSYKRGIRYEEQDVRLLEFVAQHIAVALTRAHAIEETRQRNTELQIINRIQAGLVTKLDIKAIYELVGEELRHVFPLFDIRLALYDPETDIETVPYAIEHGKRIFIKPYKVKGVGFDAEMMRKHKTILINEKYADAMKKAGDNIHTEIPKSALLVPLIIGDTLRGNLEIDDMEREHAFSDSDVRLVETLANSMSFALENAHLFDETQHLLKETEQRNTELQIINSVQEGLASKLDLQDIYELIGEKVREVFNVQVVDIVNYDPVTNLISMPYSYEKGDRSVITPRKPYGFRQQVINSHAPLLINQNFEELASQYNNPLLTGAWPKSALFMPLLVDGKVTSIISIQDIDSENAFSASDVQLLQTLSNAMGVALENARLFEETQHLLKETERRAQELATVNTVSAAMAGELDMNTLIRLVGEQIRSVFKADIAFVALLDRKEGIINFPYQYGQHLEPLQWGEGITSKIIQRGQPLIINRDMDRQRERMGVMLIGKRARSFLGVPIFVGSESIGVVSVQHSEQEGLFTDDDQRLLSTIAANIGIAFQNARLFNENQRAYLAERQAHEQAETLRSVAHALNRSLSLREVFDLVLTEIQKVIPYDSAGVYQVQDNRRVFVTGRGFSNLDDLVGVGFELNQQDDKIGYLISQSLQPIVLEDAPAQYPQYFSAGPHSATTIRSYMAVPIVLNQKLIGMITLDREEPGFYQDQHARLAMVFAAQAATAINNARLFDETQRLLKETEHRNTELAIINRIQKGLASKLDIQAMIDLFGDELTQIFPPQERKANNYTVFIALYNPQTKLIQFPYLIDGAGNRFMEPPTELGPGLTSSVIRSGVPLVLNTLEEQVAHGVITFTQNGIRIESQSWLGVPIKSDDQVIGVVSMQDQRPNLFAESDVRLLSTLASSLKVALENARLWEQEKMYRRALQRELEIGREIQRGFLPETLPQVEGWEIAASLMSAREVAGDFYDAFELPDGTIGLVIADVCDKGVGAALFMTLFRSLIRVISNQEYFEHAGHHPTEQSIAERLKHTMNLTNNYIAETHEKSGMFATVFFGILDPKTGKLLYVNGGHEPPFIIRSGHLRETLYKTGPAVGIYMDHHFDTNEIRLSGKDMFVAYTDGVPDCKDPQGEFFGRERLLDISQHAVISAEGLVRHIENELTHYLNGANQFDDIALIAVRKVG